MLIYVKEGFSPSSEKKGIPLSDSKILMDKFQSRITLIEFDMPINFKSAKCLGDASAMIISFVTMLTGRKIYADKEL